MSIKVLIVDDNEAEQFLCEYAVHKYNKDIHVLKACDGNAGLSLIKSLSEPLDLIFLDVNMPGMNGFEFLEHYHHLQDANTNIVMMLTVALNDGDYKKCMSYPKVIKVIPKPLSSSLMSDFFESQ